MANQVSAINTAAEEVERELKQLEEEEAAYHAKQAAASAAWMADDGQADADDTAADADPTPLEDDDDHVFQPLLKDGAGAPAEDIRAEDTWIGYPDAS